jgi:hypothetical protein
MLALFTSYVCDWCDGTPQGRFHRGWVAWDEITDGPVTTLVFRSHDDASRWGLGRERTLEVREVLSAWPFAWTQSRGSMRDLELADRPISVYRDHRYPDGPNRAFLAPAGLPDGSTVELARSRRRE